MDFSVVIANECAGKSHVHLNVTVTNVNGTRTFPMMLPRADWPVDILDEMEEEEVVKVLIRHWFKTDNPPPGQLKARLEAQVFKY